MPITLNTGKLNIKNSAGEYVTLDAVADATTAEKIQQINNAGAAQVAAVQQKGAETLATIPNDYAEIAGDVTDLKSQIAENTKAEILYAGADKHISSFAELEQGMIAPGTQLPDTSKKYRVITANEILFANDTHVMVGTGFRFSVITNNNGTRTSSGWMYSDYIIPAGSLARVQIARISEDITEVADITTFDNAITLISVFAERTSSNTKNMISSITEGKNRLDIFTVFVHGILDNNNGGINANYKYRACSKDLIHATNDIHLYINSGYRIMFAYFVNNVYSSASSWFTTDCTIKTGETVRIQIGKVSESTSEMCNIEEMLNSVYFYSPYTIPFCENNTYKIAGFKDIVWENRGTGSYEIVDDDTLKVTAGSTSAFYIYGRVDVSNTNTVTLYYKGWAGTGRGSLRVGVTNASSGTTWTWINYIHTDYTVLDVTGYDYVLIALYANITTGTSGDYAIYKDLMVYNGDAILGYTQNKSAFDATARGTIDTQTTKLSRNNLFLDVIHRGGYYMGQNGENRLEAIEYNCAIGGFRAIEIDILFTADNVPVMCHLDVNTAASGLFKLNGVAVDVTISEKTYAELQEYDYIGTKIAKFEDGLVVCKKYGVEIVMDKTQNYTVSQNEIIQALLKKYSMVNVVWWTEYNTTYEPILAWNPKAKIIFSASATAWLNDNTWTNSLANYPNASFIISFDTSTITDSNIDDVLSKVPTYMSMYLYTVNDLATYKKRFSQVSGIVSDYYKHGDVLNNLIR